jgi:glycosyltransferase involved in cell wall biosynthesis
MHVAFVHRRGPGQFRNLARRLIQQGAEATLIAESFEADEPGLETIPYALGGGRKPGYHRFLRATDHHVGTGEAVAACLERLARTGRRPDIVVGHLGWGGLLFMKDVLPEVPALGYCEFYHRGHDSDLDFDASTPVPTEARMQVRVRNAAQLLTLHAIEAGLSPTHWQKEQYPQAVRGRISVCHDGIDTQFCRPDGSATLTLRNGRTLSAGEPIVTYAARNLEPYRGFPQFMRAAARVAAQRADVTFLVIGRDGVSYGRPRDDGRNWRDVAMEECGLDPARVLFVDWLPYDQLIRAFQISSIHVYLTYPFVLSWSFLEAMACGALVLGSATPPVQEVLTHGRNGLLADFHDPEQQAELIMEALASPQKFAPLRDAARKTVLARYELDRCLARQSQILESLL